MDPFDLRIQTTELAEAIHDLINAYETVTGFKIADVRLNRSGEKEILSVWCEVKLEVYGDKYTKEAARPTRLE